MSLKFRYDGEPFDGRKQGCGGTIIDEVTGNEVGYMRSNGTGFGKSGGIRVSLFDGKYSNELHKFEECWGFMKGVEAVLNHMMDASRATKASNSDAA